MGGRRNLRERHCAGRLPFGDESGNRARHAARARDPHPHPHAPLRQAGRAGGRGRVAGVRRREFPDRPVHRRGWRLSRLGSEFLAMRRVSGLVVWLAGAAVLGAEDGSSAWLRYAALDEAAARSYRQGPAAITAAGNAPAVESARQELIRGIRGMLARTLRIEPPLPADSAILRGTLS